MFRGETEALGHPPTLPCPDSLKLRWTYHGEESGSRSFPAAIVDGIAYVGSTDGTDPRRRDLASGKARWEYKTKGPRGRVFALRPERNSFRRGS